MTPEQEGRAYWSWYIQHHVPGWGEDVLEDWLEWKRVHPDEPGATSERTYAEIFRLAAEGDPLSVRIRNRLMKHRLLCGE